MSVTGLSVSVFVGQTMGSGSHLGMCQTQTRMEGQQPWEGPGWQLCQHLWHLSSCGCPCLCICAWERVNGDMGTSACMLHECHVTEVSEGD